MRRGGGAPATHSLRIPSPARTWVGPACRTSAPAGRGVATKVSMRRGSFKLATSSGHACNKHPHPWARRDALLSCCKQQVPNPSTGQEGRKQMQIEGSRGSSVAQLHGQQTWIPTLRWAWDR